MGLGTRKIAGVSVLLALSLIAFMLENFLPPMFIPGAKLGLGNAFSMLALVLYSPAYALLIVILRCVLGNLIVGSLSAMLFGLCAGVVSVTVSVILWQFAFPKISFVCISVCAAVIHNVVQCIVFCAISGTWEAVVYLPYLVMLGAISGFAVGLACVLVIKRVPQSMFAKIGANVTVKKDNIPVSNG